MATTFIILLAITLLFPMFPAKGAEQARVPARISPKVDNFFKHLERARSFSELKEAFAGARFSQEDLANLKEAAKQPLISEKLRRLIQEEQTQAKSRLESRSQALIKQKEVEHQHRQETELKQVNSQTILRLQSLRANTRAIARPLRPTSTPTASRLVQKQAPRPSGSSAGIIRSLTPSVATIGKSLTISGDEFGTRAGRVVIGIEGDRLDCPVSRWSQREIVVTVPEEFQPFVGITEKLGFIWVKLHGSEIGPYREVRIRPDIEGITPVVTSLSTTELKPGAILLIEGRNFFAERRGTVKFRFGNKTINGRITDWQDTYITAKIHELTRGLARTDGVVVVRNHLGLETMKAITFVPRLVTTTLRHARHAYAIFYIGYKGERTDFNIQLKNGWTVKENYLECDGDSLLSYGCRFVTQANPGSTHAFSRTVIWVDLIGHVDSMNCLVIEGPAGLRYQ